MKVLMRIKNVKVKKKNVCKFYWIIRFMKEVWKFNIGLYCLFFIV